MFDLLVRQSVLPPSLAELDDWDLIEGIQAWERLTSWVAAWQLAAIAELARRGPRS